MQYLAQKIQYCCTICVIQFVNHRLSYVDIHTALLLHFVTTETCCASQTSGFLGLVSNLAPITPSFSSAHLLHALSCLEWCSMLKTFWHACELLFGTSPSQHICPNLQHFLSYWILHIIYTQTHTYTQGVSGGIVHILGGCSMDYSK